ncbi:MAG: hypothetical protein Q9M30_10025 [Mariprofundaceae bacterium]|nr:hypothetical protein [Mariprofundaceae bacterium]
MRRHQLAGNPARCADTGKWILLFSPVSALLRRLLLLQTARIEQHNAILDTEHQDGGQKKGDPKAALERLEPVCS